MLVADNGYRAIAHDRRGHGRSSQPWTGHDLDTYADDLAQLLEQLDLREVVPVGNSTGGGEVTRYLGRHGTSRVAMVVLLCAITPLMLKTDANRQGTPMEAFDVIRHGRGTGVRPRPRHGRPLPGLRPGPAALVRGPGRAWLDLRGLVYLQLPVEAKG
jgi:pimeloyl-ACP methyl ester carboxylesterase